MRGNMERQLRLLQVLAMVVGGLCLPHSLWAEGNPFEGETIIQNGPQDGSANDPIVQQSVGDVNSIQDNSAQNEQRGRREKIEQDAIPKGKAGVGAAIGAGVALTAAGTPMLASPFLSVRLRGQALLAKAALEFAQAAATAGVNQQNKKASDALRQESDNQEAKGEALQTPEEVKEQARAAVNSPELQKVLGEKGINSDYFVDQLASGALGSPAAMASMMGETEATPEMLAAAAAGGAQTPPGNEEMPHVTYNDGNGTPAPQSVAFGGSGGTGSRTPTTSAVEGAPTAGSLEAQARAMAERAMEVAKQTGADKLMGLTVDGLMAKYLASLQGKKALAKGSNPLFDYRLFQMGIRRLRAKQNIFHMARKSYRDFGKWRRMTRRPKARLARADQP